MIKRLKEILGKKKIQAEAQIDQSLQGVADDIDQLKRWALYINQRHEHKYTKNKARITITKKETEKLQIIISNLQQENLALRSNLKEMVEYLFEAHKKLEDTETRLIALEKDTKGQLRTHTRTLKRTNEGQIRTPSREQELKVIDKGALTASQKELLDLLYRSTEPLDYRRIAHTLRKKEKSIRNLIYEIREKGVKIKDTHIGFRKKGFYLEEDQKLEISGR